MQPSVGDNLVGSKNNVQDDRKYNTSSLSFLSKVKYFKIFILRVLLYLFYNINAEK